MYPVRIKLYNEDQNEIFYLTFTIVGGNAPYDQPIPHTLPTDHDGSLRASDTNVTIPAGGYRDIRLAGGTTPYYAYDFSFNNCAEVAFTLVTENDTDFGLQSH